MSENFTESLFQIWQPVLIDSFARITYRCDQIKLIRIVTNDLVQLLLLILEFHFNGYLTVFSIVFHSILKQVEDDQLVQSPIKVHIVTPFQCWVHDLLDG